MNRASGQNPPPLRFEVASLNALAALIAERVPLVPTEPGMPSQVLAGGLPVIRNDAIPDGWIVTVDARGNRRAFYIGTSAPPTPP